LPVARIPRFSSASFVNKSQLARGSSLFIAMAILETSRLTMRPFREDDVDLLSGLMANQDFMRFSLGVYTREQTIGFLEKLLAWQNANKPSLFAAVLRRNEMLLAIAAFIINTLMTWTKSRSVIVMHPDYWNQGLATEAARAVRDHAFRDLKLSRVISLIHPENIPSQRVAEKIGMSLEKQTIYRGFLTNVFSLSRARWGKENAA
jgi:[ribosomal protein S5]-alanine N-acetyltransferase